MHNFILKLSHEPKQKKGMSLAGFDFFQETNTSVFHFLLIVCLKNGRGWEGEDVLDRGGDDAVGEGSWGGVKIGVACKTGEGDEVW